MRWIGGGALDGPYSRCQDRSAGKQTALRLARLWTQSRNNGLVAQHLLDAVGHTLDRQNVGERQNDKLRPLMFKNARSAALPPCGRRVDRRGRAANFPVGVTRRATVIQKKTGRPVQFEITEQTRAAIQAWLPEVAGRRGGTSSRAASGRNRTCRRPEPTNPMVV